jgi:eukaryotic-like serine/threonine-protein kinase
LSPEEHAAVSKALEEACDFAGAARHALFAGDPRRAAHLAALGGDDALCHSAMQTIVQSMPRGLGLATARDLLARGFGKHAGLMLRWLDEPLEAAAAFAAAGDARQAAQSFESAARSADAARTLEAALRRNPDDAALRLDLGLLLARHGRTEAAIKALQRIDPSAPERTKALPVLARLFTSLGLEDAARTLRAELGRFGPASDPPDSRSGPDAPLDADTEAPRGGGTADPREQAGALLFGRYQVVRDVATTAHARVVEALDRVTAERVAVKLFAGVHHDAGRDALLRFEREARALDRLRHPHVVPLRGYFAEWPAIVLAWMPGGSLADWLKKEPITPARAVEIVCAVLSALGEAHRLGILHRDVKPANVLFDDIGTARLSDFGAAHLGDLSSTATAGAIGTLSYMSPEQRMGRPAEVASDIYGAGVLLAELLTGEALGPASHGRIEPRPSSRNRDLTPEHDAVVALLVEEHPERRPADAFEARRALRALAWPDRIAAERPLPSVASEPAAAQPALHGLARLSAVAGHDAGAGSIDRRHDTWLRRDVLVVPMTDDSLAQARAFARAGHAALPAILRADAASAEIWIALPRGSALAREARPLSPGQIARLREAVESLHAAGGAHGYIDAAHLYWHDGEVTIAYPTATTPEDACERDATALAQLEQA